MKKILLTLILCLVLTEFSRADLGLPTIQAICRVTLLNRESVEGIITFGGGGYDYSYKPHGFCFAYENGVKRLKLFNFYYFLGSDEVYGSRKRAKLFYVNNISSQRDPERRRSFEEKAKVLIDTSIVIRKYELLEEMIMYKKLPLSLYVGNGRTKDQDQIVIDVNKIGSLTLLKTPSQKWINLIETARVNLVNDQRKNGDWEDYLEPAWYHEIICDKETVNYLQKHFR